MFLARSFFGTRPAPLVVYSGTLTVGKYGPWFTPGGYNNTVAGRYDVGSLSPATGPRGYGVYLLNETATYYKGGPYRQNITWLVPSTDSWATDDFGRYEYDVTLAGQTVRFSRIGDIAVAAWGDPFNLQGRNGQALSLVVTRIYP